MINLIIINLKYIFEIIKIIKDNLEILIHSKIKIILMIKRLLLSFINSIHYIVLTNHKIKYVFFKISDFMNNNTIKKLKYINIKLFYILYYIIISLNIVFF